MEMVSKTTNDKWLHVAILIIATVIAYAKLTNAGFNTWDDPEYVLANKDIRSFSAVNISNWFSEFYIGNYHPLTILSYTIDFAIGKTNPLIYHITNLLLHIGNGILVYAIFKKLGNDSLVALFTALLFLLHPVQTESVAWIAERKNVLYGLFFLSATYSYIAYCQTQQAKRLLLTLVLGLCAMLSKAAAVTLPLSLFAIDIWLNRPLNSKKIWVEKLPLFALAVVIGIVGIKAQEAGAFLNLHHEFSFAQTIIFAGYAYTQYIVQLLMPIKLSVLYPYPKEIGMIHILYAIIALAIVMIGYVAYRKRWLVLCGGIVFFTVNIALVLQFVQFGEVLMADRYLYIACIGVWFPIVHYAYKWFVARSKQIVATAALGIVCLGLLSMTYVRNDIWLSETNFWQAITETFPNSSVAQNSLGGVCIKEGNYALAITHIDLALQADQANYKAWYNKGVVMLRRSEYKAALFALDRAISIHNYSKALFTRALLYQQTKMPEKALADVELVLQQEPGNARAHFIKASCLEQQSRLQEAIAAYKLAINHNPNEPMFYTRHAVALAKAGNTSGALAGIEQAIALAPNSAEAWYWKGMIKYNAGQSPCADLKTAAQYGSKEAAGAMSGICK